jgi:hypothetical protein
LFGLPASVFVRFRAPFTLHLLRGGQVTFSLAIFEVGKRLDEWC